MRATGPRDVLVCMERKRRKRQKRLWRCVVAVLFVFVLFVVVVWRVPWWLDDHYLRGPLTSEKATIVSGMRTALVALGAGALAVAGLFYTHHTLDVAREGHITDRITKAVEQLGSAVIEVRLGGIYALERIMHDSERDHYAVVQVLAAFVREHGRGKPTAPALRWPVVSAVYRRVVRARQLISPSDQAPVKPAEDVQAALTVLVQRPEGRREPDRIDLSGVYLRGAHLKKANLKRADLYDTHLEHAQLQKAEMRGANLSDAHLEHADLSDAHLPGTKLYRAFLECTNLYGTDLEQAKGLKMEQVLAARPAPETRLPAELAASRRVQKRIMKYGETFRECSRKGG